MTMSIICWVLFDFFFSHKWCVEWYIRMMMIRGITCNSE